MATLLETASLVMVPSGYEDGTLGSLVPTDASGDFTFTRGSNLSATRVNEDGYIEKGRENQILHSNAITTSPWSSSNLFSETQGHTGYDGSNNAWLIIPDTDNSTHYKFQSLSTTLGVTTISAYVKSAGYDYFSIRDVSSAVYGRFDLATGNANATGSNAITGKIESVGNDWWRCSLTFQRTATGLLVFYVNEVYGNAGVYAGDGIRGIYLMNVQVEQGLVATDYIETTAAPEKGGILADLPRIDYFSGRASLLLEPQRSNLFKQSEYFEDYQSIINVTITANTTETLSPEGLYNAAKIECTGGWTIRQAITLQNVEATTSFWVKAVDPNANNDFKIRSHNDTSSTTFSATGEWVRYDRTYTGTGSYFGIANSLNTNADLYIYGFQVEQASYPTSYIPTYGTSQTRLEDLCVNSGDVNTFNSTEGVFYFEGNAFVSNPSAEGQIYIYNDSGSELISIRFNRISANNIFVGMAGTTGTSGFIQNNSVNLTNTFKLALKYSVGNWKLYVNGNLLGTTNATTFSANTLNSLNFSSNISTIPLEGNVGQVLYFPTALSDEACIELTTL